MSEEVRCCRGGFGEKLLVRDLPYLGAGLLVLVSLLRAIGIAVGWLLFHAATSVGVFLVFIIAAYFIGMIIQKGASSIGILQVPGGVGADAVQWAKDQILAAQAGQKLAPGVIRSYESCSLKALCASTVGSGSLASAFCWLIAMIVRFAGGRGFDINAALYLIVCVLLIVVFIICLRECSFRRRQRVALLEEFKRIIA